ncbi:MAG: hypothetical protein IPN86_11680 [Saprospiraceae bacterium]|nr:hypothetical protein [Saprospiraceae bacterium]
MDESLFVDTQNTRDTLQGIKCRNSNRSYVKGKLEEALKMEGDKVVYTHTSQEVQQKLKELGTLISQVLAISGYTGAC